VIRKNDIMFPVATQPLVDCSKQGCWGCKTGWPKYALDFIKDHGITDEDSYPYIGQEKECQLNDHVTTSVLDQTFFVLLDGIVE